MNSGDLIVLGVIVVIIGLALTKIIRDKKKGKCVSGCANCPYNGKCHMN